MSMTDSLKYCSQTKEVNDISTDDAGESGERKG